MTTRPAGSLLNYREHVPDSRGRHGQRHPLAAMLAASICAILSGFHGDTLPGRDPLRNNARRFSRLRIDATC